MHISRYVVDDEASEKEFPQGVRDKGRAGRRLDDFERDPQAVIAGLKKPELAALRVYTSPAFPEINDPLRDQTRFRERRPHPLPRRRLRRESPSRRPPPQSRFLRASKEDLRAAATGSGRSTCRAACVPPR